MNVQVEQVENATIVTPEGDVDLSRSPSLLTALKQVQAKNPKRLVVDLGRVDYMDSSGVATLVQAFQVARRAGTKMVLCAMRDRVRSIFEIAKLETVFTIVDTREAALRA